MQGRMFEELPLSKSFVLGSTEPLAEFCQETVCLYHGKENDKELPSLGLPKTESA